MKRKMRAFTLVELLVVIGIIVLLTGILVPSVRVAMRLAQWSACRGNLKGVGAAFHMHLNEHNGLFPFAAAMPSENLSSDPGIAEALKNELGGSNASLQCPGDVGPGGEKDYYFNKEQTSYLYMSILGGENVDDLLSRRHGSFTMFILSDMQSFHGEAGEYGSTNYLFVDGSVGDLIDSEKQEFKDNTEEEAS